MKPAFARIGLSLPLFAAAGYLLEFTTLPYAYPFAPFLVAMYLYFRGIFRYWVNHHTSYFVTDRRVVNMYRFAWLETTEIPVHSINSISEARSFIEMITARGSVVVASGIGSRHKVQMQEIDNPAPLPGPSANWSSRVCGLRAYPNNTLFVRVLPIFRIGS